jgi:hypothetical protein
MKPSAFPITVPLDWKELTGNPRVTWGVANSGTHGERAMKAFIANDGLFWVRIKTLKK